MGALARASDGDIRVYLVGGATAVLQGWREATIDVDCVMRPENDAVLRAIPEIKERLQVNVELASPADFIPVPPGWEDRGTFITRIDRVDFLHFDMYAQALAKVERGHGQDLTDVREMLARRLIDPRLAREYYERIKPQLFRFPAIDAPSYDRAVAEAFPP